MENKTSQQRFERLLNAIDAERKSEASYFKTLHEGKSLAEKVKSGFIWYPVNIIKFSYTVGDHLEIEIHHRDQKSDNNKFSVGVAAILFNIQDERKEFKGTVSYVRGEKLKMLVHSSQLENDDVPTKGLSGIELVYDERPYKVMDEALKNALKSKKSFHETLIQALSNRNIKQKINDVDIYNEDIHLKSLNDSQKNAVKTAAGAEHIAIIHGPPGTGKTTTLVALTGIILKTEKRVLVCASSNNAVDVLAERLSQKNISVLRIGNVTRINDDLIHLTLDEKVRNHAEWVHIKKVRIQARDTDKKASQYKRQFGLEEKEERKALRKESRELRKWAYELENRLVDNIVHSAQVIATTLIGVSNKNLENINFDTVIIDEASQALEPECWNAILKANRVILAGDHKQLPPTVKSQEAIQLGFETTILDLLAGKIDASSLLDTQYRMHQDILGFSNERFYEGKLKSFLASDGNSLRNDRQPLVFIDTAGCGFEELFDPNTRSFSNPGEYLILREHLLLHKENMSGSSIGIISPYKEQVKYISQEISEDADFQGEDIEVNSIDGFQGQEKEIIYISLVRSNDTGDIGFLKDERRLNVAMTRAQKKLVILGDSATIGQHGLYSDLIDHVQVYGHYDSAWNYMGY